MTSYYHVIFILYIALFSKLYIIFLYVFYNPISFLLFFSFFAIVILTIAQNFQIWQMVCAESIFKDILWPAPNSDMTVWNDSMKWQYEMILLFQIQMWRHEMVYFFRFRCDGMKWCTFSDAYDKINKNSIISQNNYFVSDFYNNFFIKSQFFCGW